jgi:hypothetical protein
MNPPTITPSDSRPEANDNRTSQFNESVTLSGVIPFTLLGLKA